MSHLITNAGFTTIPSNLLDVIVVMPTALHRVTKRDDEPNAITVGTEIQKIFSAADDLPQSDRHPRRSDLELRRQSTPKGHGLLESWTFTNPADHEIMCNSE